VPTVLSLFSDQLGLDLDHVLDRPPDLLFGAAKFPQALLDAWS
jgi:hypothetical protein